MFTEEHLKQKEKKAYSILCIFTPYGHTFTFKNVSTICNNETTLQFNYAAMSDGKERLATFPKNTFCGWSTTPKY